MKYEHAIEVLGGEENAASLLRMPLSAVRKWERDEYGNLLSVVLMDRILAAGVRRRAAELAKRGELSEFEADIARV